MGLGQSIQKMFYLPEAHTDFIFPIVGEELGLFATLGVVIVFLILTLCGGFIAGHANDLPAMALGMGATALVGMQAVANLAVVTGLLPPKGLVFLLLVMGVPIWFCVWVQWGFCCLCIARQNIRSRPVAVVWWVQRSDWYGGTRHCLWRHGRTSVSRAGCG